MYKGVYVGIFDRNSRRGEVAIDLQDLLLTDSIQTLCGSSPSMSIKYATKPSGTIP